MLDSLPDWKCNSVGVCSVDIPMPGKREKWLNRGRRYHLRLACKLEFHTDHNNLTMMMMNRGG
ncbi:hypothetical protein SAY86_024992 [Trapa natans]|uniref:Uncharacterized protein n=1 Tax=Trapa natans TaxID=22666 RepID=A0AAN7MI81_TRANT|nr:hypothetical protein SAY86_024992 [Trapa natans]